MHISLTDAANKLAESNELFIELFSHGTLSVEFYKPDKVDHQKPHDRDEVYIIASGHGDFYNDGRVTSFGKGDFIFVKAGKEHRFLNFSDDFSTWVLFYGPKGGE
jgi:mannose-6-phosphate isomerase-like protein (cupin superfamily)